MRYTERKTRPGRKSLNVGVSTNATDCNLGPRTVRPARCGAERYTGTVR